MKILVDMNLSPDWVLFLGSSGIESVHWSTIGDPKARDSEIMEWALQNAFIVFTHDLDFGTALALTNMGGPSIVQVRTQEITPAGIGALVLNNLRRFQTELEKGALLVLEEARSRVRILPLRE